MLESQMFAFSEPKRAAERLTLQNQQLALSAAIASAATPRAEPCCSSPAVLEGSSPLPCACRHPSPKNSPVWALLPEQPFPAGPDSMAACGRGAGRQRCRQRHARQRCRQGHGRHMCRQEEAWAGRGVGRKRCRQAGAWQAEAQTGRHTIGAGMLTVGRLHRAVARLTACPGAAHPALRADEN